MSTMANVYHPNSGCRPYKSEFKPIPESSTFLIDVANLLGLLGPVDAARNIGIIGSELEQRGYRVAFFLERRAWGWCMHNQVSERHASAWREFSHDSRLSLVDGESDLAMLQVASVVPDAYVCTRDHLADYGEVFPEIVRERRRSFSSTNLDGRVFLAIDGLVGAIVIDSEAPVPEHETAAAQDRVEVEDAGPSPALHVADTPKCLSDGLAKHECIAVPVRYLSKIAEKDISAYYALADMFAGKDAKLERKYLRLAVVAEKRGRETSIRDARRLKAAKRGDGFTGHFSHRRQKALGLVEFARVHGDIVSYRTAHRPVDRIRGRAA